jgi:hypothetical protein
MRGFIQILVVLLLLNAAFQAAWSYYTFYDFRAKLSEQTHNAPVSTTSQLHQRAVDLAEEYGLDLGWDDVQVRIESNRTIVDFAYVDDVPFIPRFYVTPWLFESSVSAVRLRPLTVDER